MEYKNSGSNQLKAIPVRQRDYDGEEPYAIIRAAIDVADTLQSYGMYTIHELPSEVRLSVRVEYYLAQVANGGHEQYFSNGQRIDGLNEDVQKGLEALQDRRFSLLFQEVHGYVTASSERHRDVLARGGFNHPVHGEVDSWIKDKDREFFQLNANGALLRELRHFLLTSGALKPAPDLQWKFEIEKIIDSNHLLQERLDAAGRARKNFVQDLVENPPLKKTYFQYAQELALAHGISLPFLSVENWKEKNGDEEMWLHIFKLESKHVLVIFLDSKEVILLDTKPGESGKLEPVFPPLGRMPMERAAV